MIELRQKMPPGCGWKAADAHRAPMLCLQRSDYRRGVTLIELLITMTIMAIIAAAILGTAAAAIEGAREKKTQSLIMKIHTLLMDRYASYETRRIDVAPQIVQAIDNWAAQAATPADVQARSVARGQMLADARLLGVRELMKKEMPDRWEDVTHVPTILSQSPQLAQTYFRRYQQLPAQPELSAAESAECLYMVIMNATGDGEARTLFSKQDIGDTDEDGAPEFIDGWGNPIGWMRWPAGVVSDLQPRNLDGTRPGETFGYKPNDPTELVRSGSDHDPFDLFRRDSPTVTSPDPNLYPSVGPTSVSFRTAYVANMRNRMQRAGGANMSHLTAYRLTPLIYSGGPDGSSAFLIIKDPSDAPLDPYLAASDQSYADGTQAGAFDPNNPDANKDNITNHLLEY